MGIFTPSGSGIATKVKFAMPVSYGCRHYDTPTSLVDYMKFEKWTAFLETQVCLQEYDANIHAGYGHKMVGGSLSVSFGAGSVGIGFSGGWFRDDYFGRTITIQYND